MRTFVILFLLSIAALTTQGQFAPQATVSGTTAIVASDSRFVAWATKCSVQRGLRDIAKPDSGYVSAGDSSLAIGKADGQIVSLGDSGIAVLQFAKPIYNGAGYDFAVFENGFANPINAEESFAELAFVEVSSDGVNYFRFPATSNTQDTAQTAGAGQYMNARFLNNLAGKYVANYGTPFDLQELSGISGLDVSNVRYVRLIDVVGSIGAHKSKDVNGRTINDPYPTAFPTGGFDLDALGVIHQVEANGVSSQQLLSAEVYPNPVTDVLHIQWKDNSAATARLLDLTGRTVLYQGNVRNSIQVDVRHLPKGLYQLKITSENGKLWSQSVVIR